MKIDTIIWTLYNIFVNIVRCIYYTDDEILKSINYCVLNKYQKRLYMVSKHVK